MLEGIRRDNKQSMKLWAMRADELQRLIDNIEENRDLITCHNPQCGCSMYVRAVDSENIVTHFARYPKTGNDRYHPTRGESLEHQKAKEKLAQWLANKYPDAEITTEYITGNQRVDVFMRHSDGKTEAHEIQRTPQKTWRTKVRTEGYLEKGIDDVIWWWLDGGNEDRSREWCVQNSNSFGVGKSKYAAHLDQRVLIDITFQRYNSIATREAREKKAIAERARREASKTRLPQRSSLDSVTSTKSIQAEALVYSPPVVGRKYPIAANQVASYIEREFVGNFKQTSEVVVNYRYGPQVSPPWIEVLTNAGEWFRFVQYEDGNAILVKRPEDA